MIKVIKTDDEYREILSQLEELVGLDPAPGSPDAERLELLALLVRDYESRTVHRRLPTPLDAIRFRMEQQGLERKDLIPYMGSRSKVSEVLAGKRALTLSMIRALHKGLGIPAESLLHDQVTDDIGNDLEWERFPIREMIRRGWISNAVGATRGAAENVIRRFLAPLGPQMLQALYRRTKHIRSEQAVDAYALIAWTCRIAIRAKENRPVAGAYEPGIISLEFMRETARLSWSAHGPLLAKEYLQRHGIALIIEPHLPRTRLDGAAMLVDTDYPVIGLTLRHDRVDSFWFCLMHELAHVSLHLQQSGDNFYDDLDASPTGDPRELEADNLAGEALVPKDMWERSPARHLVSADAAEHLAKMLRIHPAIVAGKMRHEARNYKVLGQLVGQGQVRRLFGDMKWV